MTVSELAALVGGQLASGADGSRIITGVASLDEAGPGDVTFFNNPKYMQKLRTSKAGAVLVSGDFSEAIEAVTIRCENPTAAFTRAVEALSPPPVKFAPGVHPSAVIGKNVRLGENVSIQPFAVIEDGATIGDQTVVGAHCYVGHEARIGSDCMLYPRVVLGARCVLGNRVILHSGAVLGADGFGYDFKDGRHVKVPQVGIVQLDDDVEVGANTCIDRARFGRTWIGEGTKIDNLVQIGHNVAIGKHSILCGHVGISGSAKIGSYTTLAGQVGVGGHLEIGDQVTIAAQSGVTKSLPAKGVYMGFPAEPVTEHREQIAHVRGLARLKARVKALEQILSESGKSFPPEG